MADGVWRTVGGRRIFIAEGEDLASAMKKSGKFSNKQTKTKEDIIMTEAIKQKLQENGIKVNEDDTVTLYHVTPKENVDKIMEEGFKGTNAPIGGMTGEDIKERSFFGFDKEWVEETWSNEGKYETLEIKVPVEYIRQGAKNDKEVYIEGNIKKQKNSNMWIPDTKPTSTFYDRIAIKRYKAKNGIK